MLYDREFLLKLDKCKNKIIYAKITALTFAENPIQTIEGRVTQGSINIDGASAVRRTCSLTIVGQNFDYNNYYWGLNTKFKLEIGVQNFVDSKYPDIIWFKQGVYIITGFNTSRSTSNFSISINGKDKMCLLNGEVGGSLESSVDFGKIDEESEDGVWTTRQIPLMEIIKNAVHTYGGEPYHNIIINDLDTYGKELMEYRLDVPAYIWKSALSGNSAYNIYLDGQELFTRWDKDGNKDGRQSLNKTNEEKFDLLIDSLMSGVDYKTYYFSVQDYDSYEEAEEENDLYIISKMQYGDTIGYRQTDLTFAGDLIANVGESITSVLDKIRNMLVEFEYFYDLDGRFVFQKKKNYINTMWGPEVSEDRQKPINNYALGNADYVFSGGELITSFNNNPNLLNIRNDFSIWGERTGISGAKIPIHLRYAIDDKPTYYKSIFVDCETDKDKDIPEDSTSADAIAILNYNKKYKTKLRGQVSVEYTTDDYDWREIIYQMAKDYYKYNFLDDFELKVAAANPNHFSSGRTGYEHYYIDLQGFWRELYNPEPEEEDADSYYSSGDRRYWNKTVFEQPYNLNFWFDFLDTEGELKQFGIKSIGARPKSIKDTNVKAIYFRDTPEIEFVESASDSVSSGYSSIQVPEDYENIFSISGQGKSAKDKLDELLYQHGYCIESATINTIPIYYLEPNSRIYINDPETNIIGYYNVSKISLPLTYNGTMSLTATKAQDTQI